MQMSATKRTERQNQERECRELYNEQRGIHFKRTKTYSRTERTHEISDS